MRYAIRSLVRSSRSSPAFTVVAVLAIALGIGVNTAIFGVVNAVLFRPLPFYDPGRLVTISMTNPKGGLGGISFPDFQDLRDGSRAFAGRAFRGRSFAGMAAHRFGFFNLTGGGEPEEVRGEGVSANLFAVLGVGAAHGRVFLPEEDEPGRNRVVVLSDSLWRRRYHTNPGVLGQSINLNNAPYTVVGVMPANFGFPPFQPVFRAELWTPALPLDAQQLSNRGARLLEVIARVGASATTAAAQAEASSIAARLALAYPSKAGRSVMGKLVLKPLRDAEIVQQVRPALLMLLGAAAFVLLIGFANVAALQMARATGRRREMAIRTSLGATRVRLAAQMLQESAALMIPAGLLGALAAAWGVRVLVHWIPPNVPGVETIPMDGRVLGFTFALTVITGILFGLVPVGGAVGGMRTPAGRPGSRARSLLLVFQVAMSMVLLISAGLLTQSFLRLIRVNPGFRAENLLTLRIQLPRERYADGARMDNFYAVVLERMRALRGVRSVGTTSSLPLQIRAVREGVGPELEGRPPAPGAERRMASYSTVNGDYFQTVGIPLRAGRYFSAADHAGSPPVVVVSQSMARQFWPDEEPLGKRLRWGVPRNPWFTVAGVVGDVRLKNLVEDPQPEFYALYSQLPGSFKAFARFVTLVLRFDGDAVLMAAAARRQVWSVDPLQTIPEVKSMNEVIEESVAPQRFYMILVTIFSGLALALGTAGLYALLSYAVSQRTHEIGVRMALGAGRSDVLGLVIGQGLRLTLIGVAVGMAGTCGLAKVLAAYLFGIGPRDVATYAGVALALMAVAAVASYIPARRAARTDPMAALREE